MHSIIGLVGFTFVIPGDAKPAPQDFAEFSRIAHAIAVKQLPKQFEDASGWGQRIEIPGNLPFMKRRTVVKVGDKLEAPHGAWRKFKGKIEDPDKNLKINVKDFKKLNDSTYRLVVDVDVTMMCQVEWQQWQKGLLLLPAAATADASLTAAIVCDVGVSLNFKKIPPALDLEPKIAELGLDLVDFKLRGGPIVPGETGKTLAAEFKSVLRTLVRATEPMVKDYANKAIVQSIKDGKGTISAGEIMKSLPKK
ncbi:MAG: hypothetical protein HYR84_14910 [Planctomycetes bacterium]|nr:hypothetical protein [Planctomycetota bacterium]